MKNKKRKEDTTPMKKQFIKLLHTTTCALITAAFILTLTPTTPTHAATKPAKIKSVKITNIKTTSAKISWKKATSKSVKGYQVKLYKNNKLTKTYTIKKRSTTSNTVSKLTANTKYTVKVCAYKNSKRRVYGKYSATKKFTTKKVAGHVHNYKIYPAKWKSVYHEPVYDLVTLPNGQQVSNGVLEPAYTVNTLIQGSYKACTTCHKIPSHQHNWKTEWNTISYEALTQTGHKCNTCGKVFRSTQERFNHCITENHMNGETSLENYYIDNPAHTEKTTVYACAICGQLKN